MDRPKACSFKYAPLTIKLKKGELELKFWQLLLAELAVMLLIYGTFRRFHVSCDSFRALYRDTETSCRMWIEHGRPLTSVVEWIYGKLGLHMVRDQIIGTAALIASLSLSASVLLRRILGAFRQVTLGTLLFMEATVLGAFANVFVAEWFRFEFASITIALGFLLVIAAVVLMDREKPGWRRVLLAAVAVFAAVCGYQVFFQFFILYSLLLLFLRTQLRFSGKVMGRTLLILGIAGAACLANYLMTHIYQGAQSIQDYRYTNLTVQLIQNNLPRVISESWRILSTGDGLYPRFFVLGVLALFAGVLFIGGITNRRLRGLSAPYAAAVLLGGYVMLYLPPLLEEYPLLNTRVLMALFSLIALLGVWAYAATSPDFPAQGEDKALCGEVSVRASARRMRLGRAICTLATFVLLALSIYGVQQYTVTVYAHNALDRMRVNEIGGYIQRYERESGVQVKNIAVGLDASFLWYDEYIPYHSDYNGEYVTSLAIYNTYPHIFNYYLNREFALVPMDEQISQTYFIDHNWDSFVPEEQMIFRGDTLYLVIY